MSTKFKIIILLLFLLQGAVLYWSYLDNEKVREVELLPYKAYLENPLAVKSMDLSDHSLEEIAVDFSLFPNLEYVNLSNNLLQEIPKALLKLPKLKTLLMANNELFLSNNLSFPNNASIERLDLSSNFMPEIAISSCFSCLKNLKYLNLNNNNFSTIPDLSETTIDTILLQNNLINNSFNLGLSLPRNHTIKYLDFSGNAFEYGSFYETATSLDFSCNSINLSKNNLPFPYELFESNSPMELKSVHLVDCDFSNSLKPLGRNTIDTLNLSGNSLFLSDNPFQGCMSLKSLDISGANMYNFDLMSFTLTYLSIDLEKEAFLLLPKLETLSIHSDLGKDILLFSELGIRQKLLENLNLPELKKIIIRDYKENGLEALIKANFPNVTVVREYPAEGAEEKELLEEMEEFNQLIMEQIENDNN